MRNWLREKRGEKRLSQYDMGYLLGISQASYNQIEKQGRQRDLKFSMVIKISDLFGISLEQIKKYEQAK